MRGDISLWFAYTTRTMIPRNTYILHFPLIVVDCMICGQLPDSLLPQETKHRIDCTISGEINSPDYMNNGYHHVEIIGPRGTVMSMVEIQCAS